MSGSTLVLYIPVSVWDRYISFVGMDRLAEAHTHGFADKLFDSESFVFYNAKFNNGTQELTKTEE